VRYRLLAGVATAGVLAAALAACSDDSPRTPYTPAPRVSVSLPFPLPSGTLSAPPASHKWKPDGLTCPTISSPAAQATGLTGPGAKVRGTDVGGGNTIFCRWGPEDESTVSAELQLNTAATQEIADAAWQINGQLFKNPLPGVGEQAFISSDIGDNHVNVEVRSGNAILSITLAAAKGGDTEPLREAAAPLANDMLSSLVPG
jgi:hypothetical protein